MPSQPQQLGLFDDPPVSPAPFDLREWLLGDRRAAPDVDGLCELVELIRSDAAPGFKELAKRTGLDCARLADRLEILLNLELVEIVPSGDEALGYALKSPPV